MRLLSRLLLVTLLVSTLLCGCATPERSAFRSIGAIVITVDTATSAYYQYREHHYNPALDLKIKEGYQLYQKTMAVVKDTEISYKNGNVDRNSWEKLMDAVSASASDLIALIRSALPKETVKQLHI